MSVLKTCECSTICQWVGTDDDFNIWSTDCGEEFYLDEGSPRENGFEYCCFCGKPLVEG
jgi:hypothetical protein